MRVTLVPCTKRETAHPLCIQSRHVHRWTWGKQYPSSSGRGTHCGCGGSVFSARRGSGKTSPNREELEPTLSPAPESFRGYVILIHPRVHGDAVLRDSAPLSLLRRPTCSLERSCWAPGPLEHPLPAHLLAFPLGQGQGQGRVGETSPTPRGQFSAKTAASAEQKQVSC